MKEKNKNNAWKTMYNQLVENKGLGTWVSNQRTVYKNVVFLLILKYYKKVLI